MDPQRIFGVYKCFTEYEGEKKRYLADTVRKTDSETGRVFGLPSGHTGYISVSQVHSWASPSGVQWYLLLVRESPLRFMPLYL